MNLNNLKTNTDLDIFGRMNWNAMDFSGTERIMVRTKRFTNLSIKEKDDKVIPKCPVAYLQKLYKTDIVPSTNSMKFIPQQTIYGFKTI